MMDDLRLGEGPTILRSWRTGDAAGLSMLGDDEAVAKNMMDAFPSPFTPERAKAYIEAARGGEGRLLLAVERDGELSGSVGAFFMGDVFRINASIAYFIGRGFWGRGIATEAIRILCRHVFGSRPIERIYAEPFARNLGSRRALEKAGFVHEATLRSNVIKGGEILDSCVYSLLRKDKPLP